jgi:serine/threonine protein phosphatase PrpC
MQVEADREPAEGHPPSATWHVAAKSLTAVAAWSQKRQGLGEDAEPTFLHHLPSRRGVLGVYDGLGGAGARHAGHSRDGRQISHAFIAARLAHLTVQSWFATSVVTGDPGPTLSERLAEVFAGARSAARNKLFGTLRRDFPTTLAIIEYQESRQSVEVTASWAGDSRCYLLTGECGLQQLSRDDSDVQDVLELLIADQPMTNVVSASGDFTIHHRKFSPFSLPCVLVCATDGFFGYVAAPALFEHVLLSELDRAENGSQWARNLAVRVRGYTGDDASLVLVALGFGSFKRMREGFTRRLRELEVEHAEVLGPVDNRAEFVAARRRSWERYRRQYLRYLDWPAYVPADFERALPEGKGGL